MQYLVLGKTTASRWTLRGGIGLMRGMVRIWATKEQTAAAAAEHAAESLQKLLLKRDIVRLLAATGASQLEFLSRLTAHREIDWARVELFHLDEYAGIGVEHPASFARYIRERIIQPAGILRFHLLDGMRNPQEMAAAMSREIAAGPVQLAFVGIGENGHLAFNDPPADFDTDDPYLVVDLDQACRQQQVGEGWFGSIDEVPKTAITISIRQLLKSGEILCIVPEKRKAKALQACLEGPISPLSPASILRVHPNTTIFLDNDAASLLLREPE